VVLRSVSKSFGTTLAVDTLDLTIERGSFTTLLGPSGCGKTTTLRMLAGFYEPDEGDIFIAGVRQNEVPPNRRNVSIVFQDYALFPHMSVLQNVSYGLKLRRMAASERTQRVGRVLEFLGLGGLEARYPHQLSGGQQQRVALGRSIVMEPDVLLMDEPLSNLDAKLRIRVRSELKEIQRVLGITTVYVTHDQDEALSLSDRVAVMADGRLQQYSEPWTLYRKPVNRFVADFVGYANVIPARVARVDVGPEGTVVEVAGIGPLRVLDPAGRAREGLGVGVMVRPEWFEVSEADAPEPATGGLTMVGRVTSMSYLGAFARVWVEVEGIPEAMVIEVDLQERDQLQRGSQLRLQVPHDCAVVVDTLSPP
jgi:ABC-type Fe3+/spermidine/putrescine transport system ATPase subunit